MAALRAFIAIGLAAIGLAVVTPAIFTTPATAYTGIHHPSAAAFTPIVITVDRGSPAYIAGLRNGNVISCLSPRDAVVLFPPSGLAAANGQTVVRLCVKRSGVWTQVQFVPALRPTAGYLYRSIPLTLLRLSVYVVFLISGVALVLARPRLLTWLFFAYCLGTAPFYAFVAYGTVLPPAIFAFGILFDHVTITLSAACLLLFALCVPSDGIPAGWRRVAFAVATAFAVPAVIYAFVFPWLEGVVNAPPPIFTPLLQVFPIAAVLVVLARLFEAHREERARLAWVAFALVLGAITNDVKNLPASTGSLMDIVTSATADLTIVVPIVMMYAILKRHIIDVRFVISRTLVYAVLTTMVVGLIGLIDWAMSAYLHEVRVAMALEAVLTIALGFVLHRTYRWLEYAVDFLLFRKRHEAEVYLQRLARTLPFAETETTVNDALVYAPVMRLNLGEAALFHKAESGFRPVVSKGWSTFELPVLAHDDDVVRFLRTEMKPLALSDLHEREHYRSLDRAGGGIVVPIFQSNILYGFVVYGPHRDSTKLDPDEVAVLERLCERAAQAYAGIELAQLRIARGVPALSLE